jgi:hypothetical protein
MQSHFTIGQAYSEIYPLHPLLLDLMEHAYKCKDNSTYCDDNYDALSLLATKVSNEHTNILLHDSVRSSLLDLLELIDPASSMGRKISHICAMLYFSQGNIERANKLWYILKV